MLYRLLRILVQITLRAYFRRVTIDGRDHLPKKGPVIFVANHPSTFMDPLVVACTVKQSLHFIAAGEYFGKGLKAWIYRHWFHMIPVYRPSTMPGDTHKNEAMFSKCFEHLAKGGSMLIFPEGNSITEKRLRELKTGVSRIALGAEKENGFSLNAHLVPVGLNYSNPHRFRSDLYINIARAIAVSEYRTAYEADEREAVTRLTQEIEERLKSAIVHIDSEQLDSLVDKVHAIYKRDLKKEFNILFNEQDREFKMQKDLVEAIEHFSKNRPEAVTKIEQRLDTYFNDLRTAGLSDSAVMQTQRNGGMGSLPVLILGFPLFLIGWVHNILPYLLSNAIARKIKIDSTFRGPLGMALGMIIFLIWYVVICTTASLLLHRWWIGLLYFPLLYVSGLHTLRYLVVANQRHKQRQLHREFEKNREQVAALIVARKAIIGELETYRVQYQTLQPQS